MPRGPTQTIITTASRHSHRLLLPLFTIPTGAGGEGEEEEEEEEATEELPTTTTTMTTTTTNTTTTTLTTTTTTISMAMEPLPCDAPHRCGNLQSNANAYHATTRCLQAAVHTEALAKREYQKRSQELWDVVQSASLHRRSWDFQKCMYGDRSECEMEDNISQAVKQIDWMKTTAASLPWPSKEQIQRAFHTPRHCEVLTDFWGNTVIFNKSDLQLLPPHETMMHEGKGGDGNLSHARC
jgi:hypothetical protein